MTPNGLLLLWQLESAGSCTRSFSLQNAELHDLKVRRKRHKASSNDEAFFWTAIQRQIRPGTKPAQAIASNRIAMSTSAASLSQKGERAPFRTGHNIRAHRSC